MAAQVVDNKQDWQVMCTELKNRGLHLLRTGLWSDCTFLVGPEKVSFTAHRLILAMASPVFETMFYGAMAELNNTITIPDVQPDAFHTLLEYVYSDEIKLTTITDACDLLFVAHKYMLLHVVKICAEYMSSNMTPAEACRIYEVARLFDEAELMEDALKVMSANTKKVLKSKCFEDAELSTVAKIFSLKTLNVDSELDLLDAAERYARLHEDTNQTVEEPDKMPIRKAVKEIRFLTLTTDQFEKRKTALLTDSEILAIIKKISEKNEDMVMPGGLSTSNEIRSRSRLEITRRMTVGFLDLMPHLSETFYVRDLAWRLKVRRDFRSTGERFLEITLTKVSQPSFSNSHSWSCIAVIETTVPNDDNTENLVKIISGPIEFNNKLYTSRVSAIPMMGKDLAKNVVVPIEVRVRTFASLDEANAAIRAGQH